MSLGNITLIGAGGAGINSVRGWDINLPENAELKAAIGNTVKVCYVDTSVDANLVGDEPAENVYVAEGIEGAGKIRRDSHVAFTNENATRQIIQRFNPNGLIVVVFSASGGSGNTIGAALMEELLGMGERVVGLVIGSSENALSMKNTLDSIKTLDVKARKAGKPFVIHYEDNRDNSDREAVDEAIKANIAALVVLAGPQIRELDRTDVLNWLRFDRVPGINVAPQLCILDIVTEGHALSDVADPISVASIISNPSETLSGVMPDYSTVGYHPADGVVRKSYHYAISVDAVPRLAAQLAEDMAEVEKRRAARKQNQSISTKDDNVTDDGMVF